MAKANEIVGMAAKLALAVGLALGLSPITLAQDGRGREQDNVVEIKTTVAEDEMTVVQGQTRSFIFGHRIRLISRRISLR
jgi:hypothetical protein